MFVCEIMNSIIVMMSLADLFGWVYTYQNGRAPAVDILCVVFQIPQKCSDPRESVTLGKCIAISKIPSLFTSA